MKWNGRYFLLPLFFFFLTPGFSQTSNGRFIENKGQVIDRNSGEYRSDVVYKVEGKDIYLRKTGISYVISNLDEMHHEAHEKVEEVEHSEEGLGDKTEPEWMIYFLQREKRKTQQLDMEFLNSNQFPEISRLNESSDFTNYFLPGFKDGIRKVRSYEQVTYHDIYDNVDVQFYRSKENHLKYDFIVKPNGNPDQIKLLWKGADSIRINQDGQLTIENRVEAMYESIPSVYQIIEGKRVSVGAEYRLEMNKNGNYTVWFDLEEYDESFELIIDPWVTNYGGEQSDFGRAVTTDSEGNVYMAGTTMSEAGISEAGFQDDLTEGYVLSDWLFDSIPNTDAFLTKFDPSGNRIWATYYGGSHNEQGNAVATDLLGNVYLGGTTLSDSGMTFAGHQNEFIGPVPDDIFSAGGDAFLVKFDEDGARIWGTYYGGEEADNGTGVAVDSEGNVFLVGSTLSTEFIAEDGHQNEFGGVRDGFLVKFNPDGTRLWGTYYGGEGTDRVDGVTVDSDGHVSIGGTANSVSGIASDGAYDETAPGAFLARFDPSGVRLWGTYFPGDNGSAVAADSENNIYLAGRTAPMEGIFFEGFQEEHGGGILDAFLVKFDEEGTRIWGTYVGGSSFDYALAVSVNPSNDNVAISGDTYSSDFPVTDCAIQQDIVGTENAFVSQFLSDGSLYCSSYFGVSHEEDSKLTMRDCYIYFTGISLVDVATEGAHQEIHGGENDAYLAQIFSNSCGLAYPETSISSSEVDVTDCSDCDGEASVQIATEGCSGNISYIDYRWSTGDEFLNTTDTSSTIMEICPGEYWVEITYNCDQVDTVFFSIEGSFAGLDPDFTFANVCIGNPMNFTNESTVDNDDGFDSFWDFGDDETSTESDPTHVYNDPGVYEVILTISQGDTCEKSIAIEVEVFPSYNFEETVVFCKDSVVVLPDGTTQSIEQDDRFEFSFESVNGCDSNVVWNVVVEPNYVVFDTVYSYYDSTVTFPDGAEIIVTGDSEHTSFLHTAADCDSIIVTTVIIDDFVFNPPNIFTPGDDNSNNTFFFPAEWVRTFNCTIVNRWGVEVYQFNSIEDEWDGTNAGNGKECPDGVYFYIYEGTYVSGAEFKGQGTVQLVR